MLTAARRNVRLRRALLLAASWRLVAGASTVLIVSLLVALLPVSAVGTPQVIAIPPVLAPLLAVAGWICALAVLATLPEPVLTLRLTSPLPIVSWRMLRPVSVAAIACVALLWAAGDQEDPMIGPQAVLLLSAEGLALARVAGNAIAWVLPTAHMLSTISFGARADGSIVAWAYLLAPQPGPGGVALSAVAFIGAVWLWAARPTTSPDSDAA